MIRRPCAPGEVVGLSRTIDVCPDPVELFVRITSGGLRPDTLLLESGDPGRTGNARSFLFVGCAVRARCFSDKVDVAALNPNGLSLLPYLAGRIEAPVESDCRSRSLVLKYPAIEGGSEQSRLQAISPVDILRQMVNAPVLQTARIGTGPLATGVFSYDMLDFYEHLRPAEADGLGWPDFEFWLPDKMIELDHVRNKSLLTHFVYGGVHATAVYNDAAVWISDSIRLMESMSDSHTIASSMHANESLEVISDMDDETYARVVERCKEHVLAGDVFQVVPSRTFKTRCTRPLETYQRLRKLNPSPYMFFINASSGILLGASPESAVRVGGKPRMIEIRPIAGTRPRALRFDGSLDFDLDNRMEAELRLDHKELAEHMMLVDLARNDVARVSRSGTRVVDKLLDVERYSHVMHLVSRVRGRLRDDLDGLSAYVACMNMGTLVGAPKIRAADILRQIELDRRGPYGGAVGYFTSDGCLDTGIIIRSAVVRDDWAYVRAGAGVVYDSDPIAEAQETRRKAQAVLRAVWEAERVSS